MDDTCGSRVADVGDERLIQIGHLDIALMVVEEQLAMEALRLWIQVRMTFQLLDVWMFDPSFPPLGQSFFSCCLRV